MTDIPLSQVLRASVVVFAVASMLSVGFGHTVRQILGPLRDVRAVSVAVVANFVLVPLIAFAIANVLPLEPGVELGLMLIGFAAGAPFLVKLTKVADSNVALGATLLVLLLPLTILYMPIVVPISIEEIGVGSAAHAKVSASSIASPLIWTMLLPLALGLLCRAAIPRWAERLQPILAKTASVALVVLIAMTIVVHIKAILTIGAAAIAAAFLLVGCAFAVGYLLGGPGPERRKVLGLGTGQRGIAAATVVATQSFPGEANALVMVVVTMLIGLLVLLVVARMLRGGQRSFGKAQKVGYDTLPER